MNLNAVDNLLYKGKNVLAHLLSPEIQIFAKGGNTRNPRGGPTTSATAEEMSVYSRALSMQIPLNIKIHTFPSPVYKGKLAVCRSLPCHLVSFMTN